MAITPRSKGLGNIGSIVNRQRQAAPTRPAPKPAPKLAPATTSRNPFAGGKTTTMAQRQASQPFRSATRPVNKIDPMAGQPNMPFDVSKVNPGMIPPALQQQPGLPQGPDYRSVPTLRNDPTDIFKSIGMPNPFNPQPRTDIPPGAMMRMPVERGGALSTSPGLVPESQPFNPNPNPGQQPFDINQMMVPTGPNLGMPNFLDIFKPQQYNPSMGGTPELYDQFNRANSRMTADLRPTDGMNFQEYVNYNNMPTEQRETYGLNRMQNRFQDSGGGMFGAPTVDAGGPAGMQPGQMFGNPNPMSSDYDELEGSKFNTNPSNSGGFMGGGGGSLFGGGGGGFSGY